MVRSFGFRTLAAIFGLAAGSAGPATALAHGLSHLRANEQTAEHHVAPHEAHAHEVAETVAIVPGEDHGHPRVEIAPTARVQAWTPALVVRLVFVAFDGVPERASILVTRDRLPGPAPPGAPPPRLRAPPIR